MNLAIISVSPQGKKLAEEVKNRLEADPTIFRVDLYYKNVKTTLNTIFKDYDAILGIMATGIMVRSLCGLIKHKTKDPAVMIMDEAGLNVISLLSGHLGGANRLTNNIAKLMNTNPVITTATDVHGILGIDELARKYFWNIENPELILNFNKALLNGKKIYLSSSLDLGYITEDSEVKDNYYFTKMSGKKINVDEGPIQILADFDKENLDSNDHEKINLRPYKLVVGLGSRKGVSKGQVLQALEKTFEIFDLPLNRIDVISTAEIKSNEEGILETAAYLKAPLEIIPLQKIKDYNSSQCSHSDFVNEKFGISGVCEPSALISAGNNSKLIFKKTAYNGVTVAVAIGE